MPNALGQNVIIQSIGACSGVIVAGAIFTLPALYILQATYPEISVNFFQIFLSSLLGGILGILFFIPFRKYFVKDMHGKYPFPEATATTQVLISGNAKGAKAGAQAKLLALSALVGGVYDYLVATFGVWAESVTTTAYTWGQALADKTKFVLSCNTSAAVLGLGYIVGLKYAFVIFAGSVFVWWFIIPLMGTYGPESITAMAPASIFAEYARLIGIGGIAMAGIIGIIKSWGIICQAVGLAGKELRGKSEEGTTVRWQRDISMKHIAYFSAIALIAVFLFFWFGVIHTLCARRRRVHGSLHGRRFRYRPQNRLLARFYAAQARVVEIPRHTGVGRYRRRCNPYAQPCLRLHRPQCPCRAAGQRHGKSNRAHDARRTDSVDPLYHRRHSGRASQLAWRSGPGFLPWHVPSAPSQHSASGRRPRGLVCQPFVEEPRCGERAQRPRHPHILGPYRRRRPFRRVCGHNGALWS